ncbi:MAG: hypothetical protein HUU17_12845 [Chthonomonadales bacterium]|nr:hypothetical protein [Chthonomonadales bacterium]
MRTDTIRAVVGKVTPTTYGADIALAPDNDTWLSVYNEDGPLPRVGDIVTVTVPRVVAVTRMEPEP